MDAHVRAAGGKRVVALPVHVQSGRCREAEAQLRAAAAVWCAEKEHEDKRRNQYHSLTLVFVLPRRVWEFTLTILEKAEPLY